MAETYSVVVDADTKRAKKSLTDFEKDLQKVGKVAKEGAKLAATGFATLAASITGAVQTYAKQEQAEIKVRQVIQATGQAAGVTAKEVFNLASSLQSVTTVGDEVILGAQSILLAYTSIGKEIFPQATEATLNLSQALGVGLNEAAKKLGKSLENPIEAITGLKEAGISFTEQQSDQIKALTQSGNKADAQKIVLQQLEATYGGLARAASEGTGALQQTANVIGDVVEIVGKAALPLYQVFAEEIKNVANGLISNEEGFSRLQDAIATAGKGVAVFKNIFLAIGEQIGNVIATISESIASLIEGQFAKSFEIVKQGFTNTAEIGAQIVARTQEDFNKIDAAYAKSVEKQKKDSKSLSDAKIKDAQKTVEQEKKFGQGLLDFLQGTNEKQIADRKSTYATIAGLAESNNKTLAVIGKAAAITTATIDGIVAVQKALSAFPPPFNFAAAALVGTATAANVAKIAGVKFADGGLVEGGVRGKDSVPALLMPNELVVPRRNFDEVVNAVAAQRTNTQPATSSMQEVIIGFRDSAFEIIESKLLERQALGV